MIRVTIKQPVQMWTLTRFCSQFFVSTPIFFPAGHWEQLPPAPSARHGSAAAAAGGKPKWVGARLVGWRLPKSLGTVLRLEDNFLAA